MSKWGVHDWGHAEYLDGAMMRFSVGADGAYPKWKTVAYVGDKRHAALISEAPAMAELIQRYLASADSPLGMAAISDIDADARALLARLEAE